MHSSAPDFDATVMLNFTNTLDEETRVVRELKCKKCSQASRPLFNHDEVGAINDGCCYPHRSRPQPLRRWWRLHHGGHRIHNNLYYQKIVRRGSRNDRPNKLDRREDLITWTVFTFALHLAYQTLRVNWVKPMRQTDVILKGSRIRT